MKIAFIGQKGIPAIMGGVERHVEEVAVRLATQGNEVVVYTRPNYTDEKLEEYKGVKLISFRSVPTKHLDAISHTFASIFHAVRKDYDVVHFHSIGPSSLIWVFKILSPRTPIVATFHSRDYFHKKWGIIARTYLKISEFLLCKSADVVIAVSRGIAEFASKKYNINPKYIPNGITMPSAKEAQEIKKWGLEKGNYILAVTRLIRHKGIHYLIDAFNELDTDKKLVIVGSGFHSDDYVKELSRKAAKNENIIFTGAQQGNILNELFSNAYLFSQPSEAEGLSIALLEGMSYGLPVLVSDIIENKEVIENTGFKFISKSVVDLKARLEILLEMENIEEYGVLARKRVDKYYNWDTITEDLSHLYKKTILKYSEKRIFFRRVKKSI
ncbi:MAG: glycosyltransferase family 4 protein [Patescibacteria group bacterium]|jgi:glycosyltransferase involved in cell wall biosynthesis|nr:glycosyltransferase family 4 protein [Patescibacteria group bacterium]